MGGSSIKCFPMGGLKHRDEFIRRRPGLRRHDFWLEPTGGIDLENYGEILQIALDAGVSKNYSRTSIARLLIKPVVIPVRRTFVSCWR